MVDATHALFVTTVKILAPSQVNDKTFRVESTILFKDDLFLELVHDRNIASRIKNTTWTTKKTQNIIWSSTCYCLLEYRDRFGIKQIIWETWIKDRQINPFKSLTSFINSNQFTVTSISSLRDSRATRANYFGKVYQPRFIYSIYQSTNVLSICIILYHILLEIWRYT